MDVTLTCPITHLCPYVDEVDVGTVTIDYSPDGDPIELHELAAFLRSFHGQRVTHEALTQSIADRYPGVHVATTWTTAGVEVTCRAVSRDCLDRAGS